MKLILTAAVDNLGVAGDVVECTCVENFDGRTHRHVVPPRNEFQTLALSWPVLPGCETSDQ